METATIGKPWWGGWHHIVRRDPCVYCGRDGGTIEHVTPGRLARRGKGQYHHEMIASACRECNQDKGAMSLLMYLTLRVLRSDESLNARRRSVGLPTFGKILKAMRQPRQVTPERVTSWGLKS